MNAAANITQTIAEEISCRPEQVKATIELLDQGSTVPFIARYRKEVTGGLDDTQLRRLDERLIYLRELDTRRAAIIKSIDGQGKLTPDLEQKLTAAVSKAELEDLYLPYKPKRRTKAQIALEAGLGPLADLLLTERTKDPDSHAAGFLSEAVPDIKAALDGARDILVERFAEDAALLGRLRAYLTKNAMVRAKVIEGKEEAGAKYTDYFDYGEQWATVPSHRALALFRARNEEVLQVEIVADPDHPGPITPVMAIIADTYGIRTNSPDAGEQWLTKTVRWAWQVKLSLHLSTDLLVQLRERAEEEAIRVFSRNLKDLLLAAPAGPHAILGLDPGVRTGVKVAAIDATGKLLETGTVYPFQPRNDEVGTKRELSRLIKQYGITLIVIGNGTASRETDRLAGAIIAELPTDLPRPAKMVVSEAGASVYSASEIAAAEMPDVDVSLRGAVSIARRLQDPLAELVKIEPKSIGVGQYQHDVNQGRLARSLDGVVEDAVNAVGVELNTASSHLLARVSGLGQSLAEAIVEMRNARGPFRSRKELLKVPRLGARTFELCAGFLRIRDGDDPLDGSAVHPEAYPLAARIVAASGHSVRELSKDASPLRALSPTDFVDDRFGLPTVMDIIGELEKPGRDPRPAFRTASFVEGVETITDLKPGMQLEGTVSNVAAFGAFVDIGVHEDGLVHISQLADRFVSDPSDVVKAGDVVKVRVLDVDVKRKRISLTMRRQDSQEAQPRQDKGPRMDKAVSGRKESRPSSQNRQNGGKAGQHQTGGGSAFGSAFASALAKKQQESR